jgi:hypothetical protein
MSSFADIVAAAETLSLDEQQTLIALLQRRIVDENRNRLRMEVEAARAEHASGLSQATSVASLIDEIRRDS